MRERIAMALAISMVAVICVGPRVIAGGWILGLELLHRLGWVEAGRVLRWLA